MRRNINKRYVELRLVNRAGGRSDTNIPTAMGFVRHIDSQGAPIGQSPTRRIFPRQVNMVNIPIRKPHRAELERPGGPSVGKLGHIGGFLGTRKKPTA